MTLKEAIKLIESDITATALFGPDPRAKFIELSKIVHPDKVTSKLKKAAENAFARLSELYNQVNGKSTPAFAAMKIGSWVVDGVITKGDIADIYRCVAGTHGLSALKIARSPKDNDLLLTEKETLTALNKEKAHFNIYLPKIHETFRASYRQTNVMPLADGFYTLSDILSILDNDVNFRHAIWMMNRLFSVLGFVHRQDYVHGAIIPEHLMYHPTTHGLLLIDWCYSVKRGEKIPAMMTRRANLYPPEVKAKKGAHRSTDIYMAMSIIKTLFKVPPRFKGLIDWCLAESPNARPKDAWELQEKWKELAKEEYGDPKYLKLDLPIN